MCWYRLTAALPCSFEKMLEILHLLKVHKSVFKISCLAWPFVLHSAWPSSGCATDRTHGWQWGWCQAGRRCCPWCWWPHRCRRPRPPWWHGGWSAHRGRPQRWWWHAGACQCAPSWGATQWGAWAHQWPRTQSPASPPGWSPAQGAARWWWVALETRQV